MGPFDLLEKLINEHGSAAVLREHIGLLKAQHAALEARCRDAEAQQAELQRSLAQHIRRADEAEQALRALQAGEPGARVCDHCASVKLQRTGTRPHPVFGDVGLREAVYRCADCGADTFIEVPRG